MLVWLLSYCSCRVVAVVDDYECHGGTVCGSFGQFVAVVFLSFDVGGCGSVACVVVLVGDVGGAGFGGVCCRINVDQNIGTIAA